MLHTGCGARGHEPASALPEPAAPEAPRNPEPPAPPQPSGALLAWEDVPSPHPAGATNPPRPVLVVTPERRCFKRWVSPFLPPEQARERVEACDPAQVDCGTEITCPPRAEDLLAGQKAEGGAP